MTVWACPGAKSTGPDGLHDGCLKLKIAAPAVDNKANEAAAAFLAGMFGLKRRQVSLESGASGRRKIFLLESDQEPDWDNCTRP